jgi:hypothetical protein
MGLWMTRKQNCSLHNVLEKSAETKEGAVALDEHESHGDGFF